MIISLKKFLKYLIFFAQPSGRCDYYYSAFYNLSVVPRIQPHFFIFGKQCNSNSKSGVNEVIKVKREGVTGVQSQKLTLWILKPALWFFSRGRGPFYGHLAFVRSVASCMHAGFRWVVVGQFGCETMCLCALRSVSDRLFSWNPYNSP